MIWIKQKYSAIRMTTELLLGTEIQLSTPRLHPQEPSPQPYQADPTPVMAAVGTIPPPASQPSAAGGQLNRPCQPDASRTGSTEAQP